MLRSWSHGIRLNPALVPDPLVSRHLFLTGWFLGLKDRGTLAPGMCADINVIDTDIVHECMPEFGLDFPGGASRFIQRAIGY